MASDILDKDAIASRNARWEQVFSDSSDEMSDISSRKLILIIEHVMQLSHVAYTMQDWDTYLDWNERRFEETYKAWKEGRLSDCNARDPSETFFERELGFLDFFVSPLAEKLKTCGMLGGSNTVMDEYARRIKMNRAEWEVKGCQMVFDYHKKYLRMYALAKRGTDKGSVWDGSGSTTCSSAGGSDSTP